jgi:hypothetical protein
MVPGVTYMLVLTGSTAIGTLKFQHLDDPATAPHPDYTAVAGATVVKTFLCPSPSMALVFDTAPTQNYYLSILQLTSQEF